MKKKIIIAIAAMLVTLLTAVSAYGAVTDLKSVYIGEEKAIEIAQNDIKKTDANDQKVARTTLDYDDGVAEYDIDIIANDKKYEYEIDAVSGAIIGKEFKMIKGKTTKPATPKPTVTPAGKYIGEDKAKAVILEFAGISADEAVFVKCKLDREDGSYVYELEFYANKYEYEAEIDALTGAIIDFEIDD